MTAYWHTVQRTNRFSMSLEILVELLGPLDCLVLKVFRQATGQLMSNGCSLAECLGYVHRRQLPVGDRVGQASCIVTFGDADLCRREKATRCWYPCDISWVVFLPELINDILWQMVFCWNRVCQLIHQLLPYLLKSIGSNW